MKKAIPKKTPVFLRQYDASDITPLSFTRILYQDSLTIARNLSQSFLSTVIKRSPFLSYFKFLKAILRTLSLDMSNGKFFPRILYSRQKENSFILFPPF